MKTDKTQEMVKGWIKMHNWDKEAVARYIASTIKCSIKKARKLVSDAGTKKE